MPRHPLLVSATESSARDAATLRAADVEGYEPLIGFASTSVVPVKG